ncbi:MAG: malate:quinone oxidoreductase [Bacteroidetes bacterium]|nr:malate:quinone oxidoreductase [Bacteroidota bacterium]MBS1757642.1 malate:quinone oxidoreductase [Bacteroidota bacterium]
MKKLNNSPEAILIGGGIMSATLAIMLKNVEPDITIHIYERLAELAAESTDGWNNAGTGHSAFCELNYTPEKEDGSIDIKKAIKIATQFEESKQFWASLVEQGAIANTQSFINNIPHLSFVWGESNVTFLKKRYDALKNQALFMDMQYAEDAATLTNWMPLVMQGRQAGEKIAATKMELGCDVNFGALTRAMFDHLEKLQGVKIYLGHEIRDIEKAEDGSWEISVKDLIRKKKHTVFSKFVFIGAGGGSLPLLEKSDIPEAAGYGGFPISGQWLRCTNETVIAKHDAKVYGKASVGAPPMSVPHLDTRIIDHKKELLFGPYAGFSTKFLKNGSYLDLPKSIEWDNIFPMLSAGWHNMALTKYLIQQVSQSMSDRINALKEYFPQAVAEDWELAIAGQRVQVIKKDEEEGGTLEFGTEIVCSKDGTIAALLGASPGASTAVSAMIDVLSKCFSEKMQSAEWQSRISNLIPSFGKSLANDEALCKAVRKKSGEILGIKY